MMTNDHFISWILVGGFIGILFAVGGRAQPDRIMLLDVVIGIVGGTLGGVILFLLSGMSEVRTIDPNTLSGLVAIISAVFMVMIFQVFSSSKK